MKKTILTILFCGVMILSITGCVNTKQEANKTNDIGKIIDVIVSNGPQTSSNPYDYIKASQEEYNNLLKNPKETFEYAIEDLINSNASKGLNSYIEALLCKEINSNFEYNFSSANDYLEHYKIFLKDKSSKLNDYDKYAKTLLK